MKQVLDLSYNVLPYCLKSCFLYLRRFVKDEEIDAERLYLLWIAEGLISSEDKGRSETLRNVWKRYLSELEKDTRFARGWLIFFFELYYVIINNI